MKLLMILVDSNHQEDVERLLEELTWRRERGQTVVFTNGCFDLLHNKFNKT